MDDEAVESIRAQIRERVTHYMTPEQVNGRLTELRGFVRPTRAQWLEIEALEEAVTNQARGQAVIAAYNRGDTSLFDQPRPAPGPVPAGPAGHGGGAVDRARRVIEARHRDGALPDYAAERCTRLLLAEGQPQSRSLAAEWIDACGDPAYERAFYAYCANPERGHMTWDETERRAFARAERIRATALTEGTGAGSSPMVPVTLDPAIMIASAGSNNPLRRICRVVQTATNQWQGVSSSGATAEWKVEGAQAADGTPPLASVPINVYTGDVNAVYSYELGMDAMNFESELRRALEDALGLLQNTAYAVGTGSGQPFGVIPRGTAVTQSPTGAFAPAHVYQLQNSMPARFSANAQWLGTMTVQNLLSQFSNASGNWNFPEIRQNPPRLAGRPWNELSDMSADVSTTGSKYLAYLDPSQFVIVDRIGSQLQILPAYGANFRPTGQWNAFLWFRTGADAAVPSAVRVLVKA